MDLVVGCSGFSYREWKGSFYPEKLPAAAMLRFYAERLPAVEINSTFYRMPSPATLARWREEVPPGFRFTLKAPQRITHVARLAGAEDAIRTFLEVSSVLGPQRGPLLFQLPPSLRKDLQLLESFLDALPPGAQVALELRHPSWHDEEVGALLRRRQVALCVADTDEAPATGPLTATASWGYLRLRRRDYDEAALLAWRERIAAQPWREAFVYFKHEERGAAPAFALGLLGLHAEASRERRRGA